MRTMQSIRARLTQLEQRVVPPSFELSTYAEREEAFRLLKNRYPDDAELAALVDAFIADDLRRGGEAANAICAKLMRMMDEEERGKPTSLRERWVR